MNCNPALQRITSTSEKRKEQKIELHALPYHIVHTWLGDEYEIAKPNGEASKWKLLLLLNKGPGDEGMKKLFNSTSLTITKGVFG